MNTTPTLPPVLLLRPADRPGRLAELLPFPVEHHPALELRLEHDTDLREAVADLRAGAFDHLVLTSPAAVQALQALDATVPAGTEVSAVGETTAQAARDAGWAVTRTAAGTGAALVEAMPAGPSRVLFPASSAAAPTVREGLTAAGHTVQQEIAYRPRSLPLGPEVVARLRTGGFAAVVLTSGMIARMVAQLAIHRSISVVSIGPVTTRAAQEAGLTVHAEAAAPGDEGLAAAILSAMEIEES
ncbi:uroporphyrinogen-III synthase [Brachybacterium sp. EF45031]|uniref:uroporphyrinogen-III synthase n=1 Tax=Brachybacterium sillae TaxID=2810536 RepID=UPI00217CFD2A|nr:uroporphyrinogen-III synthase [Brachybacterium sillae]MCS6712087.1 uroporphyrinogen-III synthase [Brachybacterium sillae]